MRDPAGLTWSFDVATALGTDRFKKAVAESLEGCGQNRLIPVDCRRCAQPSLEHVFAGEEGNSRGRDALILVAHVTHGYRLAEIARFLAVAPSTVSKALSRGRRWRERAPCWSQDRTQSSPQ
jgi:DNA-directed RNA polymerase specialized sigma24 family protein